MAAENFKDVYVRNIPESWSEEKLKDAFSPSGKVMSISVYKDRSGKRFGILSFETSEQGQAAITAMNGQDADGSKLYVARCETKEERTAAAQSNLFVKNLDFSVDDDGLKAMFAPFGTITSHKVMREPSGTSKGFGFVCFSTAGEASQAVTGLHAKVVAGKQLYVGVAEKKEQRASRLKGKMGKGKDKGFGGKMGKGFGKDMSMGMMGMKGKGYGGPMGMGGMGMGGMGMGGMGMMGKGMPGMGGMGMMGKGGMPQQVAMQNMQNMQNMQYKGMPFGKGVGAQSPQGMGMPGQY